MSEIYRGIGFKFQFLRAMSSRMTVADLDCVKSVFEKVIKETATPEDLQKLDELYCKFSRIEAHPDAH